MIDPGPRAFLTELARGSAIDYMERVLGYSPRTAQERLRVARALGSLPMGATILREM